jgi:hypothetical protein
VTIEAIAPGIITPHLLTLTLHNSYNFILNLQKRLPEAIMSGLKAPAAKLPLAARKNGMYSWICPHQALLIENSSS